MGAGPADRGAGACCGYFGGGEVSAAKPTIASLQRKIERLEARLQAAQALNLRINGCDMQTVVQNADRRELLRQIAEMAGGVL